MVQICNIVLVGAWQNNQFFTLKKWKMIFLCNENENFLRQHCSPLQDGPMCTIWDHLNKLCHESSHNIRHLTWKSWIFVHGSSFLRTPFQDICRISILLFLLNATMHICVKFGYISTNYVMNVAKTLLVSLESYECLFMIASFWEHVFNKLLNCKFIFFLW